MGMEIDSTGALTLSKTYDPYGVPTTVGTSVSSYGFTNEYQSQGLIYLRARMYSPVNGRFLTRDTWDGDYYRPLSLNRWNYVEGNPVNRMDPSGLCAYAPADNVDEVESHVSLSKSDWLNTYTVAGLAMQCWATGLDGTPEDPYPRRIIFDENKWPEVEGNDSWGPAQVSYEQTLQPYGTGDNLRCYVLKYAPNVTFCFTQTEFEKCSFGEHLILEPPLDPFNWQSAATLMKRRIQHALDTCKDKNTGKDTCGNTDKYIIASMAQNGPGFLGMDGSLRKYKDAIQPGEVTPTGVVYYWENHFKINEWKNAGQQLERFKDAVEAFERKGWAVPNDIPADYILKLINVKHWWTP